jgi:hypothetical protein
MHLDSTACTPRRSVPQPRRTRSILIASIVAITAAVAACAPPTDGGSPGAAPQPAPREPVPVRAPEATPPPGSYITPGARMTVGGCPTFPADHAYHADITRLPRAANSDAMIAAAGAVRLGTVYSTVWEGSRGGIPINVVDGSVTPKTNLLPGTYSYLSDLLDHPIPAFPKLEGHPGAAWDRHMLVIDSSTCISHELFYAEWIPFINRWKAATAVKLDLRSNAPKTTGTSIASGGSMLAGMLRFDEVESGVVDHALAVGFPIISNRPAVWPAFGTDGTSTNPNAPRMGTWLRLRSDADLSQLAPDARVIATALQRHGAIISDTGPGFGITGESHEGWNDADLATLGTLDTSDFEVVDPTPMKISDTSYQIR